MKVSIIGAGFSSMTAACYLQKAGYDVTVFEKNGNAGGRASQYSTSGFTFDIGPTWYWMPGVFEKFFNDFGKKASDYYQIEKLSPAYKVYFDKEKQITIGDTLDAIAAEFERYETGAGSKLKTFIAEAGSNYDIAINDLVYKPGDHIFELATLETFKRLPLFIKSISSDIRSRFSHPYLRQLLEFPVLFLGAKPSNIPAFYNFMNYADYGLGTYYPKDGMYAVGQGFYTLAQELGVRFVFDANITSIGVEGSYARSISYNGKVHQSDIVLSGADYQFTETLLDSQYRNYSTTYWDKKTFSPSALLFFVGFEKKIQNVEHHTLFFDVSFEEHAKAIYDTKSWPETPLFYASFPSKTDETNFPKGKEAGIFLIPIAPGIEDTEAIRSKYFNILIERLEHLTNQEVKNSILFHKSYCIKDFQEQYNAYKGNAYGLANTLLQTHILRPSLSNKKVKNMYYTGQLTLPGPGVPPAIISGNIVSQKIIKNHKL